MGALHPERVLIGKSPFRGPVQEREAVRELLPFSASIHLTMSTERTMSYRTAQHEFGSQDISRPSRGRDGGIEEGE